MTKATEGLHYIYDEALKVEREYGEVPYGNEDGKAGVGDHVYYDGLGFNVYYRITSINDEGITEAIIVGDEDPDEGDRLTGDVAYPQVAGTKLSPTGNVRLSDGQRYRLAERKAAVGERVIKYFGGTGDGTPRTVTRLSDQCVHFDPYENEDGNLVLGHVHGHYRVLEPLESAEPAPQAPPKDTADLLANLVRRVAELETENHANSKEIHNLARENESILEKFEALTKEMASIRRDLQTFAEVAETAKHTAEQNRSKPKEVARKVIDDINEYYAKGGCV